MGTVSFDTLRGDPRPARPSSAREDALARARRLGHRLGDFRPDPAFGRIATTCQSCGLHLAEYPADVVSGMALWLPCTR